jgi:hypothetical protein
MVRLAKCCGASIVALEPSSKAEFLSQWSQLVKSDRLDCFCKANLQQWVQGQEQPVLSELVSLVVERGLEDLLTEPDLLTKADLLTKSSASKEGKPWSFDWDWSTGSDETLGRLSEAFGKRADAATQEELVLRWSRHRDAIALIESLIRRGALSKESLRVLPASWWDALSESNAKRFSDLKPQGETDTARAVVSDMLATIETGGEQAVRDYALTLDKWDGPVVLDAETIAATLRETLNEAAHSLGFRSAQLWRQGKVGKTSPVNLPALRIRYRLTSSR